MNVSVSRNTYSDLCLEKKRETGRDTGRKRKSSANTEIAKVHIGFNRMCVRAGTK